MLTIDPLTPAMDACIHDLDFTRPVSSTAHDEIYAALLQHLVVFIRGVDIGPREDLTFAQNYGELDEPHQLIPDVGGFENRVKSIGRGSCQV